MSERLKISTVEIRDYDHSMDGPRKIGMAVMFVLAVATTGWLGENLAYVADFVLYAYVFVLAINIGSMWSGGSFVEQNSPDWFNAARALLILTFLACGLWLLALAAVLTVFTKLMVIASDQAERDKETEAQVEKAFETDDSE